MSAQIKPFNLAVKDSFSKLKLFTFAITRAHGKNHPEVHEVRKLFKAMNKKVKKAGKKDDIKPDLDVEFTQLRKITNNYTIPGDACETYAGTYNMLSELDKSYHA